ncbi:MULTISPECIES: hypothetical protein [Bacillaceae]|nr:MULTISPECIES: hypothetical protein [Bacillaceae]
MSPKNQDPGQKIQNTVDELKKKGVPPRTAAYAASMGYLRAFKKGKL